MNIILKLRAYRWYILGRRKIRRQIREAAEKNKANIVLGSSYIHYKNWISTDLPHFNITLQKDWDYLFSGNKANRLLTEHVLEHLTPENVAIGVKYASQFLKPGGVFRIAVPDEWNPDPVYYEAIRIGGSGPGAEDHYSMWNIESMSKLLNENGFEVKPYEYWTKDKQLVKNNFSDDEGPVRRSCQRNYKMMEIDSYTSLIVDAVKK